VTIFGSSGQGANGTNNLDSRSGSVNGGKSDQANVTLDGADVNDQNARTAFTTVLRVTPDSVEEFRSTTTNGDAATGRGSGADVALVTKSGTNQLHGSLYEFRRGTETAANSFFNNRSGVKIPFLLTNLFGGTVGGPIKKNKAFFFLNYEGRRDRSATAVSRIVPSATMQQGILLYHDANKVLQQVGPAQIKQLDPAGIGISQAGLALLNAMPAGNDSTGGDGLNTTGYRFNSPVASDQNTYIAKLDYKLDSVGKHSLFWRGNLQNDSANQAPQFPGLPPNSVTLANNKGFAAGWTGVLTPALVNTFRYVFTRVATDTGFSPPYDGSAASILPTAPPPEPPASFLSTRSATTFPGTIARTISGLAGLSAWSPISPPAWRIPIATRARTPRGSRAQATILPEISPSPPAICKASSTEWALCLAYRRRAPANTTIRWMAQSSPRVLPSCATSWIMKASCTHRTPGR
jgi:hypothetical protein